MFSQSDKEQKVVCNIKKNCISTDLRKLFESNNNLLIPKDCFLTVKK